MWDRHYYWHAAHQSFRNQYRASRQTFRGFRPHYRYRPHRRHPVFGVLLVILFFFLILHQWPFLVALAAVAGLAFLLRRIRFYMYSSGNSGSYQPPSQYYQPSQQPHQPNQYYQPSSSPQPDAPSYRAYGQGYQESPRSNYQQSVPVQPYQTGPSQPTLMQYEEPQTQYPQEMPPMV
jgi:hypothetical protein